MRRDVPEVEGTGKDAVACWDDFDEITSSDFNGRHFAWRETDEVCELTMIQPIVHGGLRGTHKASNDGRMTDDQ